MSSKSKQRDKSTRTRTTANATTANATTATTTTTSTTTTTTTTTERSRKEKSTSEVELTDLLFGHLGDNDSVALGARDRRELTIARRKSGRRDNNNDNNDDDHDNDDARFAKSSDHNDDDDNNDNNDNDNNNNNNNNDNNDDRNNGGEETRPTESAVWHDSDDEDDVAKIDVTKQSRLRKLRRSLNERSLSGSDYAQRLRERFVQMQKQSTQWAQSDAAGATSKKRRRANRDNNDDDDDDIDDDDDSDNDNDDDKQNFDVTRTTKRLIGKQGHLSVTRLKDLNWREPNKAAVQASVFHPSGAIALTAGLDKTLRLFRTDGVLNEKLRSVFFADMPLHSAFFVDRGASVLCCGRRKHL